MMQIFTIFLLIVLVVCQWGYAETIPSASGTEGGPASTEVEDFVPTQSEEIEDYSTKTVTQSVGGVQTSDLPMILALDRWAPD